MGATLKSNIPELVKGMRARASRVVRKTALSIEADIKGRMAEPKSGRQYKRGEKTHTASAPGESPAIDHGALAGSIEAVPVEQATYAVGSSSEIAPVMELGGAHTEARPLLGPAFERARDQFEIDLREVFEG